MIIIEDGYPKTMTIFPTYNKTTGYTSIEIVLKPWDACANVYPYVTGDLPVGNIQYFMIPGYKLDVSGFDDPRPGYRPINIKYVPGADYT